MNVVYLDQNIVIGLVERNATDRRFRRARETIVRLVESRNAVFPYSEIHLSESAAMSPDSRARIGKFWDTISRGYRFIAGKEIRSLQFQDVFDNKPTRFSSHLVMYRERTGFAENIDHVNPALQNSRANKLREVVEYWAKLKKEEIDRHIRKAEAATSSRLVMETFNKMLRGRLPALGEIFSEYNTIASDLSWRFRDKGDDGDALFKAVAFMRDHALKVHALGIECVGLESLAEQYAIDNEKKRPVQTSQLDHDSNDLATLSNFVPYCVVAISDGNAVGVVRRAYKKLRKTPPVLFTWREIEGFTDFLEAMPIPEPKTEPQAEAERTAGQTLFIVPWQDDELVGRESLAPIGDIRREILPFGGLKVWSEAETDWSSLLTALETSLNEMNEELGGEAMLYGGRTSNGPAAVSFQVRVPFGMFDLCRDDVNAAFHRDTRSCTP